MTQATNSEIASYHSPILVYDGSCGFCSRSVRFMLRHERRHDLLFVTRDSELGRRLRRTHRLESIQSMLWIEGGQVFTESGAVMKAAGYLGGWWSRLAVLGSFCPSFYDHYCYLPLYIVCGEHLLGVRLRPANRDASAGALEEIEGIVGQIRQAWPHTRIILRADSGFCREALLSWCEANQVDYAFGFARNERLRRIIDAEMQQAAALRQRTGQAARVFTEFAYQTHDSWSKPRRVVAKAEQIEGKENPRYVVTSLAADVWPPQQLYQELYCARADMENRIKEQYSLFAGRVSAATLRANQLRLYLSAAAYLLLSGFRRLALAGTGWARSQCDTIRWQLLRIGAQVRITARKVWVSLASSYPHWQIFEHAFLQLRS